jgi:Zn-dependent peptidase ImmA (M78 family)/transcriptional regulator with XRE-family HTH domain
MPADLQLVARRLKSIRDNLEYTVSEVSSRTGLPIDRISGFESAGVAATGDEILILAAFYECDFRTLLDDQIPGPDAKTGILFRRFGATFSADDRRAVQEFVYLCQVEQSLESALGIRKQSFSAKPVERLHKDQGKTAAGQLRSKLGYRDNEVPRNVFEDFRQIGTHVFRRRLKNEEVSALYVNDNFAGHCVLVNYNEDIYRQRFSAAHEVAHSLFDSNDEVTLTYTRASTRYDAHDLKEIRANSFAAAYLMPPSVVANLKVTSPESAASWAQQLRVSTSALANALQANGQHAAADIARTARVPASLKIDPEAPESLTESQKERRLALLERGLSDHFVNLGFEAHHKGLISTGRLIEALRVDRSDLVEVAALYGRQLQYDF